MASSRNFCPPRTSFYSYASVLGDHGEERFEVTDNRTGAGVGIYCDNRKSANGVAQTLNNAANRLVRQRQRNKYSVQGPV